MSIEFLQRIPLFADLPESDLQALMQQAQPLHLPAGAWLIHEGEPGEALYVVLAGELEITKRVGEQTVVLAVRGAGDVIGEIALFEETPRTASARALQDCRLLTIDKRAFQHVLRASPTAAVILLRTIHKRLQSTEAMLRQNEKMAAVGTLAAGLAHELNNPASAVLSSAGELRTALDEWETWTRRLGALQLTSAQAEALSRARAEMLQRAASPAKLDALARSDQESALQDWLESVGVEQAWTLAPPLVTFGVEAGWLQRVSQAFAPDQVRVILQWLAATCALYALVDDVHMGARRMAEIVRAVKSYVYLDQAPLQSVDVHEGLENTLVILRHKLGPGLTVQREYAPDLPRIEAYGSELNQVWTNLIDNAIDAMQGQGQLTLRTYAEAEHVVVEIVDSGPGIPPAIQARIFEPFFTTKAPGAGTGLGLHIAYQIVERHAGQLRVTSQPGATCFQVRLPIHHKRGPS